MNDDLDLSADEMRALAVVIWSVCGALLGICGVVVWMVR